MKTAIHPDWHAEATVVCACGNTFTIGSTVEKIHVEVCSKCHPFYTGVSKFIDSKGRVERFKEAQEKKSDDYLSKKLRRQVKRQNKIETELARPESLGELRKQK